MIGVPKEKEPALYAILTEPNPIAVYQKYYHCLSDCNIVLFDGKKDTNISQHCIDKAIGNYYIMGIGNYRNAVILNKQFWEAAATNRAKQAPVKIGFCIDFDSNIMSYLPKALKDGRQDDDFCKLLWYIKSNYYALTCLPYSIEDSLNKKGMKSTEKVYQALLYFYAFSRLTIDPLGEQDFKNLALDIDIEDYQQADDTWNEMIRLREHERDKEKRTKSIYCLLLETMILKHGVKKPYKKKMETMIRFVNEQLGVYLENALYLCGLYLLDSNHEGIRRFFSKMQPAAKNLTDKIAGMAWDLFHISNLPEEMRINSMEKQATVLNYFITRDQGLKDIIQWNPVQRMVFDKDISIAKYKHSILELPIDEKTLRSIPQSQSARERLCMEGDLETLITVKEKELMNLRNG